MIIVCGLMARSTILELISAPVDEEMFEHRKT
ncbi:hypothetical protein X756_31330 [Mesorhizobium sp. LSHC412B00]|nr:hypothetical protein X756_31330 [Mesorhizobium sp. LSHC412B00]